MHSECVQATVTTFANSQLPVIDPLTGTLKPQSNGPLHSNTLIGTWVGYSCYIWYSEDSPRRGLAGLRPCPVPSSLYQM